MTDGESIVKKLAHIETCIQEIETLVDPPEILTDLRAERFTEHTLQIAIQAAQDVASHIISDQRLGEPRTSRELFEILARYEWIPDCRRPRESDRSASCQPRLFASLRPTAPIGWPTTSLARTHDICS